MAVRPFSPLTLRLGVPVSSLAVAVATLLLLTGYPVAVAVIARWPTVVRERRWRWFAAHEAGMAAIVAGWLVRGRVTPAVLNGGWLVVAVVWFVLGGRRSRAA